MKHRKKKGKVQLQNVQNKTFFYFYSFYFKFVYVNILVWFVVLIFVSEEGVKPKAHLFCFVLYILELNSTCFCFF